MCSIFDLINDAGFLASSLQLVQVTSIICFYRQLRYPKFYHFIDPFIFKQLKVAQTACMTVHIYLIISMSMMTFSHFLEVHSVIFILCIQLLFILKLYPSCKKIN